MLVLAHKGKVQTIPEWSAEIGISTSTIYRRMNSGITDPAKILAPEIKQKKSASLPNDAKYACHGKSLTIEEWAKELGYTVRALCWRLKNQPISVALSQERRQRRPYEYDGKSLTVKEWAEKCGYSLNTMYHRLRYMPIEVALQPNQITDSEPIECRNNCPRPSPVDVQPPPEIDQSLVAQILAETADEPLLEPVEPLPQKSQRRRRKPNPIRVSPLAVQQMRQHLGRKDKIYNDDNAIRARLRRYLAKGSEVEAPRGGAEMEYSSSTARYCRYNNWILCVEGLHIKCIQHGDVKRWRTKK
jgi:predicted DNA-binding transcriptional regulator AlpA